MADDSTLFKIVNGWSSNLTTAITATDTTITLDSVDGLPASGGVLTFTDTNEIIHYTAISGNNLTVERGYDGTVATSHRAGQGVEMRNIAALHNLLKDEIIAHESASNPHQVTASQVGINSTDDVSEGSTNKYYTDARVSANTDVSANTSDRHTHSNKAELDLVTDGDHDVRTDNPHAVTKEQVGAIGSVVEDTTPQLGGDLDTNGKHINAINQTNSIENQSKLLQTEDLFADFVVSGLLPATSSDFTSDISAGTAYVTGVRVVKTITSHTYNPNLLTYVDLDSTGTYTFVESDNTILVEDCEDAWDESVDSGVTSTADTSDYKVGTASAHLAVDDSVSAGDILATEAITSTDLSSATKIRMWIKSSVDTAAGDLQLLLDDSADCATPLETLDIPALTANTWTEVELTLANPASDTAIISVGLKYVTDLGACDIWLDDLEGITNPAEPAVTADSMRLAKVVTDASSITEVDDLSNRPDISLLQNGRFSIKTVTDIGDIFGVYLSGSTGGNALFASNLYIDSANHYITPLNHSSFGFAGINARWGSLSFYTQGGSTTAGEQVSPSVRMKIDSKGNIGLFGVTYQFGGGEKVLGIANATTVPSSNPTGGGVLYVQDGALYFRGSSGTVTTIANA